MTTIGSCAGCGEPNVEVDKDGFCCYCASLLEEIEKEIRNETNNRNAKT